MWFFVFLALINFQYSLGSVDLKFLISVPKLWNSLPTSLRDIHDPNIFNRSSKIYLIEETYHSLAPTNHMRHVARYECFNTKTTTVSYILCSTFFFNMFKVSVTIGTPCLEIILRQRLLNVNSYINILKIRCISTDSTFESELQKVFLNLFLYSIDVSCI